MTSAMARAVSAGVVPVRRWTEAAGTPDSARSATTVAESAPGPPMTKAPTGFSRATSALMSAGRPEAGDVSTGPQVSRASTLAARASPGSFSLTITTLVTAEKLCASAPPG